MGVRGPQAEAFERAYQAKQAVKARKANKLTGGLANYYVVRIDHPQRGDTPYQAECEDIIEALQMNPDEANLFKEVWRSAAARQANGKPGHTALYGAEKLVHYAGRILRRTKRESANDANGNA